MYQKGIDRNSRSLSERFKISWFATQNWLDRGEVHQDGRVGTERFHLSPINWGVWEIQEKLIYLAEHIWPKCTDETDFREALSNMHRLHRESGEERLAPIPFYQYQKLHSSSTSYSTSWWQWKDHWSSSKIHQSQFPLSSWNERHQRTGRPV